MVEFIAWVPGNLKKNIKGNGVHTLLHISYYVSISYFSNRLMFIHGLYNVTGTTTPNLRYSMYNQGILNNFESFKTS